MHCLTPVPPAQIFIEILQLVVVVVGQDITVQELRMHCQLGQPYSLLPS